VNKLLKFKSAKQNADKKQNKKQPTKKQPTKKQPTKNKSKNQNNYNSQKEINKIPQILTDVRLILRQKTLHKICLKKKKKQ
jgi:hypothetical protein